MTIVQLFDSLYLRYLIWKFSLSEVHPIVAEWREQLVTVKSVGLKQLEIGSTTKLSK